MKRIVFLLAFLLIRGSVFAQEMDEELRFMVKAACALRGADVNTYESVKQLLTDYYPAWTPMNETGPIHDGECANADPLPRFKLNRMLTLIAGEQKYVRAHGDMLNGEDDRYDYSLYERSIQGGKSVSYELMGREGAQWFILVPYQEGSGLSASVRIADGNPQPFIASDDGTLWVFLNTPALTRNQTLTLTVNGGAQSTAFILLNHNTRSK